MLTSPSALLRRFLAGAFILIFAAISIQAALQSNDILTKLSPAEIEAQLPNEHPSTYYIYVGRLEKAGDFPGALRWFYIGQLRYRIYLRAHPREDSSLFASLNYSMGPPLSRYGALHMNQWLAAIDAALVWDDTHDNAYTDKNKFAPVYAEQRAGLVKLKSYLASHADQLKAAANGQEPMPTNWPGLVPISTTKDLEGVFGRWNRGSITSIFFKTQPAGINWFMSSELELRALTSNRLLVIARGKQGELARSELEVTFTDGAASFLLPDTIGKNPRGGGSKSTAYLRRNAAKDLVVERDEIIEEYHNIGVPSPTEPHRYWQSAPLTSNINP